MLVGLEANEIVKGNSHRKKIGVGNLVQKAGPVV